MVPKGMLCTLPTSASGLLALSARAAESFPRYVTAPTCCPETPLSGGFRVSGYDM